VESGSMRSLLSDPQAAETRELAEAYPEAVGAFR
jgi:hypothetical protein